MKIANGSFPIDWEESEDALYVEGLKIPSSVRTIGDMKDVLYDAEFAKSADKSKVLYYMHRGVLRRRDSALFESNRRRFDVTVVLPGTLGSEFTKTVGHYHELSPAAGHQSYPEIYEILHGAAHFMIFSRMVRVIIPGSSGCCDPRRARTCRANV